MKFIADFCIYCALSFFLNAAKGTEETKYDHCCSFPCKNHGICYTTGFESYACDCTRTGHYGKNCEFATFSTNLKKSFTPTRETLQHFVTNYRLIWKWVNKVESVRKFFMNLILQVRMALVPEPSAYIGMDDYTSMNTYINKSVYARTLPPIPKNCPFPMGTVGPRTLPDAELLVKEFLLRRKFRPCPRRTNVVFPMFAQHFNHQYFKTNAIKGIPFQWGNQMVDVSHIYGDNEILQSALRSHVDGKMKVSSINGEEFPPRLHEIAESGLPKLEFMEKHSRFAFGHKGFAMMPSFLLFSTIWIREHNRVCDILKKEHPEWSDERLYQTARLIITGETIKIIVEDYVQHLSGFHFKLLYDPDILMGSGVSNHNQIHIEFHTLYHWHSLVPDILHINGSDYALKDLLMNPSPFVKAGLKQVFTDFNSQFAGAVSGGKNQGAGTLAVAIQTIKDGRTLRLQSFNNYRKQFGLKPHKTFEGLTGEKTIAARLRDLYKDIDAVELFIGLILEKRRSMQLFGETLTEMGAPYSLKGLFGHPLGSISWWKPVTFGGNVGMNIIKTANLQKLICDNVADCPEVGFRVPNHFDHEDKGVAAGDNSADILMSYVRNLQPPVVEVHGSCTEKRENCR